MDPLSRLARPNAELHVRLRDSVPGPGLRLAVLHALLLSMVIAMPLAILPASVARAQEVDAPAPSRRVTSPPQRLEASAFASPESCRTCHPQHYAEWSGSMHAYAMEDPVFHAMHRLAQEETRGEIGTFCVGCHSPIGTRTGEVSGRTRGLEGLSATAAAGVSCEVCHRGVHVESGHPESASFLIDPAGPMLGGIADPVATPAHASRGSDTLRDPRFCGTCHNVTSPAGVRVEKPFDEHIQSVYPDRNISCLDCHMQVYTGRATPDGPIRSGLRRHDFVGVDTALTPFPRRGLQRREIEAFLRTAARLELEAPASLTRGDRLRIDATVKNIGAGHDLPTGPSTERELWIELRVESEDGETLFASGLLDANGDLKNRHSALEPDADPQLALYTDHFVDAAGDEVFFMWQAARLVSGTIPALESRTSRYEVDLREADVAPGERVRVHARLLFRAFPPHQLRRLSLGELAESIPIFEVARVGPHIVELSAPEREEGIWRVPGDAPDLAAAFANATDGDTILLEAGDHEVRAPLVFAGRHLRVVGRRGAAHTRVVRITNSMDDAVFVLEDGEGPDAMLEGLTFVGPADELDELSFLAAPLPPRGSAIRAVDASPTIVDCAFLELRAGTGGAIHLERSSARILGCDFDGGGAREHGGAIAAFDSSALIEGCSFHGSSARVGGAVAMSAGSHLRESLFGAHRALDGGAIAILEGRDAESRTHVERIDVFGSSAVTGGAILVERTHVELFRVVLAGNIGSALAVGTGASVRLDRSTLVDNRLGTIQVAPGARLVATSSIFWDNRPAELQGEISYSIVEDDRYVDATNRRVQPLLEHPASSWERCNGDGPGCVPILRDGASTARPTGAVFRRYLPGRYGLLTGSPAISGAAPGTPPDADGSRAEIGAIARPASETLFVRGDIDGDGRVDPADLDSLVRALEVLAAGGPARAPLADCPEAADLDDNGAIDTRDLLELVFHLHAPGAPAPRPPYPDCGVDPHVLRSLGCERPDCSP